jgi:hypothetical protein
MSPTSELGAFQLLVKGYIGKAKDSGYSDDQVAILQSDLNTGSIAFEGYKTAVTTSLECINLAGIRTQVDMNDQSYGFPFISYSYESPASGNPTAEACIRENSEAVEALYQMQPSSVDAGNQMILDAVPEISECLKGAGIPFDPEGLSADEIATKLHEMGSEEGFLPDGSLGPVRTCMMNAGF